MSLRSLFSLFSSDLAIDLGTANTLVYAKGKGIVVNEPSIIAVNQRTGKVEAVGKEAKEMLGRTPANIIAIRPMKDGVIADFEHTEKMLDYFIKKAHNRSLGVRPRIVICVPSDITQVEKRAVKDSAYRAKASEVFLVEEAMAAAIGAGLPVTEPTGNMIVDIGGGTTEIAIISLNGIVFSKSIRVAGDELDMAIINYMKRAYNLLIGERTAEEIKMRLGSAYPLDEELTMEVKGRDLSAGLPKTLNIRSEEIREALQEPLSSILVRIKAKLPEVQQGIRPPQPPLPPATPAPAAEPPSLDAIEAAISQAATTLSAEANSAATQETPQRPSEVTTVSEVMPMPTSETVPQPPSEVTTVSEAMPVPTSEAAAQPPSEVTTASEAMPVPTS